MITININICDYCDYKNFCFQKSDLNEDYCNNYIPKEFDTENSTLLYANFNITYNLNYDILKEVEPKEIDVFRFFNLRYKVSDFDFSFFYEKPYSWVKKKIIKNISNFFYINDKQEVCIDILYKDMHNRNLIKPYKFHSFSYHVDFLKWMSKVNEMINEMDEELEKLKKKPSISGHPEICFIKASYIYPNIMNFDVDTM